MRETMDRLSRTSPDLFARNVAEGAPLGGPGGDCEAKGLTAAVVAKAQELSAAVMEGGSNGGFPEQGHNPYR